MVDSNNNINQVEVTPDLRALPTPKAGARIIMDERGIPIPIYNPPESKEQVQAMLMNIMSDTFTPFQKPTIVKIEDDNGEVIDSYTEYPATWGLKSNFQLIFEQQVHDATANGNLEAADRLLDRVLGKPKQAVESVNMNMTFADWLSQLDKEENPQQPPQYPAPPVDITPNNPAPSRVKTPSKKDTSLDDFLKEFDL